MKDFTYFYKKQNRLSNSYILLLNVFHFIFLAPFEMFLIVGDHSVKEN